MTGFIYTRENLFYDMYDSCKLGKSIDLLKTDEMFADNEPIKGHFSLIIKVNDAIGTKNIIKKNFKNYNIHNGSGNDFYKKNITNEIIPFLINNNINHEIIKF